MRRSAESSKKPSFSKDLEHLIVALVSDAFKAANAVGVFQPVNGSGDGGDFETFGDFHWKVLSV